MISVGNWLILLRILIYSYFVLHFPVDNNKHETFSRLSSSKFFDTVDAA